MFFEGAVLHGVVLQNSVRNDLCFAGPWQHWEKLAKVASHDNNFPSEWARISSKISEESVDLGSGSKRDVHSEEPASCSARYGQGRLHWIT